VRRGGHVAAMAGWPIIGLRIVPARPCRMFHDGLIACHVIGGLVFMLCQA